MVERAEEGVALPHDVDYALGGSLRDEGLARGRREGGAAAAAAVDLLAAAAAAATPAAPVGAAGALAPAPAAAASPPPPAIVAAGAAGAAGAAAPVLVPAGGTASRAADARAGGTLGGAAGTTGSRRSGGGGRRRRAGGSAGGGGTGHGPAPTVGCIGHHGTTLAPWAPCGLPGRRRPLQGGVPERPGIAPGAAAVRRPGPDASGPAFVNADRAGPARETYARDGVKRSPFCSPWSSAVQHPECPTGREAGVFMGCVPACPKPPGETDQPGGRPGRGPKRDATFPSRNALNCKGGSRVCKQKAAGRQPPAPSPQPNLGPQEARPSGVSAFAGCWVLGARCAVVGVAGEPVSRSPPAAIPLGRRLPAASSGLPGGRGGAGRTAGGVPPSLPMWSCSRWGLPCRPCRHGRGGLLPHRFTLTPPLSGRGGLLSVALSLALRPVGVTHHPALWSPDFPRGRAVARLAAARAPLQGRG